MTNEQLPELRRESEFMNIKDPATTSVPDMVKPTRLSGRAKGFLLSILLVLLVFAAFQPALNNGFTSWDDPAYVTSNVQIQQGVTWQNVQWAFTHNVASNWHPLTVLSHMLDCQLFGPKAWGHHLVNLLWHGANAVLLFWLLCFSPLLVLGLHCQDTLNKRGLYNGLLFQT